MVTPSGRHYPIPDDLSYFTRRPSAQEASANVKTYLAVATEKRISYVEIVQEVDATTAVFHAALTECLQKMRVCKGKTLSCYDFAMFDAPRKATIVIEAVVKGSLTPGPEATEQLWKELEYEALHSLGRLLHAILGHLNYFDNAHGGSRSRFTERLPAYPATDANLSELSVKQDKLLTDTLYVVMGELEDIVIADEDTVVKMGEALQKASQELERFKREDIGEAEPVQGNVVEKYRKMQARLTKELSMNDPETWAKKSVHRSIRETRRQLLFMQTLKFVEQEEVLEKILARLKAVNEEVRLKKPEAVNEESENKEPDDE